MNNENYKKIVVVPMYNEGENVVSFCRALLSVGGDFLIILSIYPSSDGTQELAESLVRENERLVVVYRQTKDLDRAYYEGFKKALKLGADLMVTMDGDFSHDPRDLPRLFEKGKENDLVIGSRYVAGGKIVGWTWKRKIISRAACILNRLILGIKVKDSTSGFRCYGKALVEHLISRPFATQGFAFQAETVARAERGNWKIREVPIVFCNRARGRSKFDIGEIKRHFVGIFRLRRKL